MRLRMAFTAALFAAGLLVFAAVPAGASPPVQYPIIPTGIQISSGVVNPGNSFTVTGEGFAPGGTVRVTLNPVLATAVAESAGNFSTVVTIPVGTPLGPHLIVASGPSLENPAQSLTVSAPILLASAAVPPVVPVAAVAAPADAPSAPLAFTGFAARSWLVASLAFVLVSTALVLGARKRRQRRTS